MFMVMFALISGSGTCGGTTALGLLMDCFAIGFLYFLSRRKWYGFWMWLWPSEEV